MIETITNFSRLNKSGTSENFFKLISDNLTYNDPKSLKKNDELKCYFVDPLLVENNKYYVLEYLVDKKPKYLIRFAKIEGNTVNFICLNDEFKNDNISCEINNLATKYKGVAVVTGYDRWLI